MERRLLISVLGCMLFGLFVAIALQACKTNKSVAGPVWGIMVVSQNRDTVSKMQLPKKPLTAKQLQEFVRPFFQMNIDTFITPKLDKLNGTIITQAESINQLSTILTTTRQRTDSIVKERNFYKEAFIKNQKLTIALQRESIKAQNESIRIQKENFNKNDAQIKANTIMAVSCLIGVFILFVAFILIYRKVTILSKQFEHHFNQTAHV